MKSNNFILTLLIVLTLCTNAFAQTNNYKNLFNEKILRSNVRFLSDDGFEGRAPGSRGGELAAKYIATQLEMYDVKPAGVNGTFFQPVLLVAVKSDPNTTLNVLGKSGTVSYKFADDFVSSTGAQTENVKIDSELVFVGYGIDAPEQRWNDYKGKPEFIAERFW